VRVYLSKTELRVLATKEGGTLVWDGKRIPLSANQEITVNL
jgi:hypothetical protein